MQIEEIKSLTIPEIKVIKTRRYCDQRGYFSELWRVHELSTLLEIPSLKRFECMQINESMSHKGTVRGLHAQWNPFVGKLVRTIRGRMVDIVLDIRKDSATFGKAIMYAMPAQWEAAYQEWIWVPPGFAHGNYFTESSHIEYLCSDIYNPQGEIGICPFAQDIDWSFCDSTLKKEYDSLCAHTVLITDKDRHALSLGQWVSDPRSEHFMLCKGYMEWK